MCREDHITVDAGIVAYMTGRKDFGQVDVWDATVVI